jgi:2-keto-3-deoxy-L-fuconate dehydrogenase
MSSLSAATTRQPFSLDGKNALVTGAASGIGYAVSETLCRAGAHVYLLDLNQDSADIAAENLRKLGYKATGIACNVANQKVVNQVFEKIHSKGRIDILVNNAGIAAIGDVMTCTEADMDKVYNVNVKGVFYCSQAAVKAMLSDNKGGSIVNLASIASLIGLADRFAYQMSKGAVLTMTYSLATDYVKKGIRCNCVCPARIHTPFVDGYLKNNYPGEEESKFQELSAYQPIGRMGKPQEVANLILYLCSDESSFCTGAAYRIDGGVCAKM